MIETRDLPRDLPYDLPRDLPRVLPHDGIQIFSRLTQASSIRCIVMKFCPSQLNQ